MKNEQIGCGTERIEYSLQSFNGSYRWVRNNGKVISPLFATVECAHVYAKRMPMLTHEEWKRLYPVKTEVPSADANEVDPV